MDMERIKKLVELNRKKRNLEMELKDTKFEISKIHDVVLDDMINTGVKSVNVDGETVYITSRIWAKYPNRDAAVAALKEAGLMDFVQENFNHITLSAYLSELVREGRELPESFKGVIEPDEKFIVTSKKN